MVPDVGAVAVLSALATQFPPPTLRPQHAGATGRTDPDCSPPDGRLVASCSAPAHGLAASATCIGSHLMRQPVFARKTRINTHTPGETPWNYGSWITSRGGPGRERIQPRRQRGYRRIGLAPGPRRCTASPSTRPPASSRCASPPWCSSRTSRSRYTGSTSRATALGRACCSRW